MDDFIDVFATFLGLIIMILIIGLLAAFPIMWLWNFVMPTAFGLTRITFWQAFSLYILSNILFKSSISYGSKD